MEQEQILRPLIERTFPWPAWEALIEERGWTIERPRRSRHPDHPHIIYPIDYGFVNDTLGTDGSALDLFVGRAENGLVGLIIAVDYRKGDREFKFLHDCAAEEIYLINGFINFDRSLMEGLLVLRRPMIELWGAQGEWGE
jgi:inorganic pyrophosphatase